MKNIQCTDHLGNVFNSIREMCAKHNVSIDTFNKRVKAGRSIEEALTGKKTNVQCTDHLGNVFNSKREMCAKYNVSQVTYNYRIKAGKSIQEALTVKKVTTSIRCTDHLGNVFNSKTEMCAKYNVLLDTYNYRIRAGKSVEEALTGKLTTHNDAVELYNVSKIKAGESEKTPVKDHWGRTFNSVDEMCSHHNINIAIFNARIAAGASLRQALTRKQPIPVKDHTGMIFEGVHKMCLFWKVHTSMFYKQLNKTGDIEYALTGKCSSSEKKPEPVKDHLGQEFKTKSDMCRHYNINHNVTIAAAPDPIGQCAQSHNISGIRRMVELVFPYYIVTLEDNSEKIMTVDELADRVAKMREQALGSNLLKMRRDSGLLHKSPSIGEWLEIESRMAANC